MLVASAGGCRGPHDSWVGPATPAQGAEQVLPLGHALVRPDASAVVMQVVMAALTGGQTFLIVHLVLTDWTQGVLLHYVFFVSYSVLSVKILH